MTNTPDKELRSKLEAIVEKPIEATAETGWPIDEYKQCIDDLLNLFKEEMETIIGTPLGWHSFNSSIVDSMGGAFEQGSHKTIAAQNNRLTTRLQGDK